MNWNLIGGFILVLLILATVSISAMLLWTTAELTIGKNTARLMGVVFALIAYFTLPARTYLNLPNSGFVWVVPGVPMVLGGYFAVMVFKKREAELKHFLYQNARIAAVYLLLILSAFLVGASADLFHDAFSPTTPSHLSRKH